MNRKQQRLDLILLPLDNFCETYNSPASSPVAGDQSWKSSFSPLQVIEIFLLVLFFTVFNSVIFSFFI